MISKDLKRLQLFSNENFKKIKTKSDLTVGFVQENVEINDQYLDKIIQNNNS